jgi:hypothetical protein
MEHHIFHATKIGDNVIEINYNKAADSGIITYDTIHHFIIIMLRMQT